MSICRSGRGWGQRGRGRGVGGGEGSSRAGDAGGCRWQAGLAGNADDGPSLLMPACVCTGRGRTLTQSCHHPPTCDVTSWYWPAKRANRLAVKPLTRGARIGGRGRARQKVSGPLLDAGQVSWPAPPSAHRPPRRAPPAVHLPEPSPRETMAPLTGQGNTKPFAVHPPSAHAALCQPPPH